MAITVRFIGSLRAVSKRSKITVRIKKEATLRDVVDRIVKSEPKLRKVMIDPELDDPRTNVLMLVNGKEISVLQGLETSLKDKDELTLIPVVHGG